MTTRTISDTQRNIVFAFLVALSVSSGALAEEHGRDQGGFAEHGAAEHGALRFGDHEHGGFEHGGGEHGEFPHEHFDARFSHNHYYGDHGYRVQDAPRTGHEIKHDHERFWYDRGEWYRWDGGGWLVVGAPVGAFVADLPPFYTTVWFGGVAYYYADDTYYSWNGDHNQYEVVEPPAGIESAGTTEAPASDSIFIYPRNGQSFEEQRRDRYECHLSAVDHSDYDPTQAGGSASGGAASKRSDYLRAETACLDAHGYSVR